MMTEQAAWGRSRPNPVIATDEPGPQAAPAFTLRAAIAPGMLKQFNG